jgi:hypothetical protein
VTKILRIATCHVCPYLEKSGGFGDISYKPSCSKAAYRGIPYTKAVSGNRIVAVISETIPQWCPLEDYKE